MVSPTTSARIISRQYQCWPLVLPALLELQGEAVTCLLDALDAYLAWARMALALRIADGLLGCRALYPPLREREVEEQVGCEESRSEPSRFRASESGQPRLPRRRHRERRSPAGRSCLRSRCGQVALDDGHRGVEVGRRTELDDRGSGGDQRQVPCRRVVRIARDVRLLTVRPAERQLSCGDDAPVLALAAVVRKPDEVRGRVGVLLETLEADRVVAERRVAALDLGSDRPRPAWSCDWHWASGCPPSENGTDTRMA